ncbi:D-alanyl-D-alanine carboxypeptidase family protein [Jannaschia sp. R86511]|uniref:M15 family metallopeptidase n=1 Tax=Jannaschia sp. R86511 TaxID=3093853 RepID=UPI0036D37201
MDGLAAVTARVQQIQGLVQSMQAPVRSTAVATTGAAGTALTSSATATGDGLGAPATGVPTATSTAFDAALSRARTTTGGAGAAGTAKVDADGVPVDLKRYGNGTIPSDALTEVGVGRHKLWQPAAEGFKDLLAAAKRAGVTVGVTDSYRSYEAQVDVARRKGLYKDGGLAAVPGTSNHGWGLSVDLDLNGKAQAWMRENADRFGFVEDVPREPWHWTFTP